MRYDKEYSVGNRYREGDLLADFRGGKWRFLGVSRIPDGFSNGRVYVSQGEYKAEFFPSVFDLTIIPRDQD